MLRWTQFAFLVAAFLLDTVPLSTRPRFVSSAQKKKKHLACFSFLLFCHSQLCVKDSANMYAVIAVNACEWSCKSIIFAIAKHSATPSVSSCTMAAGVGNSDTHSEFKSLQSNMHKTHLSCGESLAFISDTLCVIYSRLRVVLLLFRFFLSPQGLCSMNEILNPFASLFTRVWFLLLHPIRSRPVLLALCLASEPSAWLR